MEMELFPEEQPSTSASSTTSTTSVTTNTPPRDSTAIKRLLEEVRHQEVIAMGRHYNRQHNRHNR